ncbi:hypothetical protein GF374_00715 [Candidatus Woesearchaeota archaeon]|nr:hypothetical protein [Candidatus Woesearchaeota archaeon]
MKKIVGPQIKLTKGLELEEKILKILGKDSSFQETLRISIGSIQKNGETYVDAAKRYYYGLIKEEGGDIDVSCLTCRLIKIASELKKQDTEPNRLSYYTLDAVKYDEKQLK